MRVRVACKGYSASDEKSVKTVSRRNGLTRTLADIAMSAHKFHCIYSILNTVNKDIRADVKLV